MSLLTKIFEKQLGLALIDQIISSGSNFILLITYARILGPNKFGEYSLIMFISFLVVMFQNSICGTVLSVNIHKYIINRYLYLSYAVVKLILLLSITGLFAFFINRVGIAAIQNTKIIYVFVSLFVVWDFMRKVLLATFKFKKILALDLIYLFSILIQLYLKQDINMVDIFIFNSISYSLAIIFILNINVIYFRVDLKKSMVFVKHEFDSMLHLTTSFTMQWFNSRVGYFVLASLNTSASMIGIINGYSSIVGVFNPLYIFLDNYLLPKSSEIYHTKGLQKSREFLNIILGKIFSILVIISIFFIIFRNNIILLILGDEYLSHSNALIILVIINLFIFKFKNYAYLINMLSCQYIFSKSHFKIFLLNLVSIYFFVYYFNIYGILSLLLINAVLMFIQLKYHTIRELRIA